MPSFLILSAVISSRNAYEIQELFQYSNVYLVGDIFVLEDERICMTNCSLELDILSRWNERGNIIGD